MMASTANAGPIHGRRKALTIGAALGLARLPFHSVGILPFLMGVSLAWSKGYTIHPIVAVLGAIAVDLIMLATYLLGEYFDYEGDIINREYNRFTGGSRVPFSFEVSMKKVLLVGWSSALIAIAIGLGLQFAFRVGPLAFPLGLIAVLSGTFYSARPFRWVSRGFGELLIGFCYGWLPVNIGYYLFSGNFSFESTLVSLPLVLAIFNVIAVNEFPDYVADKASNKANLTVRFGKKTMSRIYAASAVVAVFIATYSVFYAVSSGWMPGHGPYGIIAYSTLAFTSFMSIENAADMIRERYDDDKQLERICMKTILIHLLISVSYTVGFVGNRLTGG